MKTIYFILFFVGLNVSSVYCINLNKLSSFEFSFEGEIKVELVVNHSRFSLQEDLVTRVEAQKNCKTSGARLATIRTKDDVDQLQTLLVNQTSGNTYWTGGIYNHGDSCNNPPYQSECWYWDTYDGLQQYNSSIIEFTKIEYEKQPDESSGIILVYGDPLLLNYDEKTSTHAYICENDEIIPTYHTNDKIVNEFLSRLQN